MNAIFIGKLLKRQMGITKNTNTGCPDKKGFID